MHLFSFINSLFVPRGLRLGLGRMRFLRRFTREPHRRPHRSTDRLAARGRWRRASKHAPRIRPLHLARVDRERAATSCRAPPTSPIWCALDLAATAAAAPFSSSSKRPSSRRATAHLQARDSRAGAGILPRPSRVVTNSSTMFFLAVLRLYTMCLLATSLVLRARVCAGTHSSRPLTIMHASRHASIGVALQYIAGSFRGFRVSTAVHSCRMLCPPFCFTCI